MGSRARAQGSTLVVLIHVLVLQPLSSTLPLPCVTRGKAWTGLLVLKTALPRKQRQIFNLAQFLNLGGDAAQETRWYEQRGKEDDNQILSKNVYSSGMFCLML